MIVESSEDISLTYLWDKFSPPVSIAKHCAVNQVIDKEDKDFITSLLCQSNSKKVIVINSNYLMLILGSHMIIAHTEYYAGVH